MATGPRSDPRVDTAAQAARELRTVVSRLRRELRAAYDSELSPSQTAIITRLGQGGPAAAVELAAAERIRPQSAATTIAALLERGLVQRTPDPADGRRQVVSLTTEGRAMHEDRRRAGHEWLGTAMREQFTESERTAILEALRLLNRLARP